MPRFFINGISSISVQPTDIFETGVVREFIGNIIPAQEQDYRSFIKPIMLRRMSIAVKMGLFNSLKALKEAGVSNPDSIIVGTGQGCLKDTEKFLQNIISTKEGLLAPTSFIQSTHNTVSGQIALELKCNSYNMTYTQNSASFESALTDSLLLLNSGEVKNVLVGGVDETSKKLSSFQEFDGQLKKENILNTHLFNSKSPGTIASEASSFFVIDSEKNNTTYAELLDVQVLGSCTLQELESRIHEFLDSNNLKIEDIDLIVSGRNGDIRFDDYYEIFENAFSHSLQLVYKHLVGENNTIVSYALWMVSKIFRNSDVPEFFMLKKAKNTESQSLALIYNQYLGKNHSFILIKAI